MFTMKKGNLVRIIALIVMIVMVASVALTSCGDKEAKDAAANAQTSADKAQTSANEAADKIATLNQTIAALQAALDELKESNAADKAELEEVIEGLAEALQASDTALAEALAELQTILDKMDTDWGEATDVVIEKWAELAEVLQVFFHGIDGTDDNSVYYYEAELTLAEAAYAQAQIEILRATSVEAADEVIDDFQTVLEALPTVAEKLDAVLAEVEENGVEYPADGEKLDDAAEILEYGKTVAEVYAEILAFGEEEVNLENKYYELRAEYNELLKEAGGIALKERMDAVLEKEVTLAIQDEVESIIVDWTEWVSIVAAGATTGEEVNALVKAEVEDIEGFMDTIEAFQEVIERLSDLEAAKDAAEIINAEIAALEKNGLQADEATSVALKDLENKVAEWCTIYEIPSDAEAEGFIQANYDLVDHAKLATLRSNFETMIKTLRDSFAEFVNAVNAIGTVTPDSGEAINVAWKAYFKCAGLNQIYDLDAVLGLEEGENVAHYYAKLSTANALYVKIVELIEEIHNAIDALAAIEDMDELQAAIDDIDVAIEILTSDEGYAQDISVLDAEKLVALEQARIIPLKKLAIAEIIAGYDRAVAALAGAGDTNETYETKLIKLENSKNGQINYVNEIKYDDKFGIDGDKTAVDEITRCGTASYIDAMYEAAIPYVPSTVYTIEFEGADPIVVGQNLYFTFPAAAEIEGKIFMGWKASETAAKVYAAGASLAATAQVAEIKWIPVYVDGFVVDDETLAANEGLTIDIDLTEIDVNEDIVFHVTISTPAVNGAYHQYLFGVNNASALVLQKWGEISTDLNWNAMVKPGINGAGNSNIVVEVTVNVGAGTVTVGANKDWKVDQGLLTFTVPADLSTGLTFTFGTDVQDVTPDHPAAQHDGITISNCYVTYTVAE